MQEIVRAEPRLNVWWKSRHAVQVLMIQPQAYAIHRSTESDRFIRRRNLTVVALLCSLQPQCAPMQLASLRADVVLGSSRVSEHSNFRSVAVEKSFAATDDMVPLWRREDR